MLKKWLVELSTQDPSGRDVFRESSCSHGLMEAVAKVDLISKNIKIGITKKNKVTMWNKNY